MFTQIGNTFNHITEAYYSDGKAQIPSDVQINQIADDIVKMDRKGKEAIGVGALCFSASCLAFPYVGPLLSLTGLVTSVGVTTLGFDLCKASENLQVFTKKVDLRSAENMLKENLNKQEASQANFKNGVIQTAFKGTIIAKRFANMRAFNINLHSKQQ